MTTVVIPARGGSKGIERKNLQTINGETLVARAIRTALLVTDRVYVSTDCPEIADEAIAADVVVVPRPACLATDEASTLNVLRQAVWKEEITGTIVLLQCTAPLTTVDDIRSCVWGAECDEWDLAVACHKFDGFVLDNVGHCVNRQITGGVPRRQDLEPQWQISGSVWACDVSYLEREWYDGGVLPILSEHPILLDIDTPADLTLARALLGP